MDKLIQDFRYGLRMMRQSPGVTLLAIVALGLGIGVNSSIFSLVNAVLLKPLPYRDPGQLVQAKRILTRAPDGPTVFGNGEILGGKVFFEWKENAKSFSHLAAFSGDGAKLTDGQQAERVERGEVTADFFSLLGIQPFLGRTFLTSDDLPSSEPTAILSHALWVRRYSADPQIIGRKIELDGRLASVIGVLPKSFSFRESFEIYTPFRLDEVSERKGDRMRLLEVLGRLKPTVTLEQARAELDTISTRAAERPNTPAAPMVRTGPGSVPAPGPGPVMIPFNGPPPGGPGPAAPQGAIAATQPILPPPARIELIGWHEQLVGNVRPTLMILFAAVGFVLLIACANVANLLLARASARQKEIAIRTALGAARARVIRQLLTESLLLAGLGGALGLLLAYWSMDVARRYASVHLATLQPITMDGWVMAFTMLIALATGVAFGLVPAFQATRTDVSESLKEGSRTGGASRIRNRFRSSLVIAEAALAVILLAGAGLLLRSFIELRAVDRGFNPEGVLTASIHLSEDKYPSREHLTPFINQLLERARALPNVESVAASDHLPLTDYSMLMITSVEGEAPSQQPSAACFISVTPDFFSTLKIGLREGRFFDARDNANATPAILVNEAFVRKFLDNKPALGRRVRTPDVKGDYSTIVGIVSDVTAAKIESGPNPEVYRPMAQAPVYPLRLAIRAQGDTTALAAAIRGVVRSIDPTQPIHGIMTMEERLSGAFAPRRLNVLLLGLFASLALLLAAVGIYGVMSYVVSQRGHEIGVRMALGAAHHDILKLILSQGMSLVGCGVAIGLIGAFALTHTMRAMLFGIGPQDPITFTLVPASLLAVAFLACWFPARRATQADPINALRCE